MKKKLFVILLVFSVISSACFSIFAATSTLSGRGIMDDTLYYIVNTCNGTHEYLAPVDNYVDYTGSLGANSNPNLNESRYAWKIQKQADGTFKIRAFGGQGRYLFAHSSLSAIISLDHGTSSTIFDICRIDSGANEGKYTIMNGNNYVTLEASNLELYSQAQAGSYWSFIAVNKGIADFYSYSYEEFNTTNINVDVESTYESWGYSDSFFLENHVPASDILWFMTENDISIYAGLGEAGALVVDPSSSTDSKIYANSDLNNGSVQSYISTLSDNALARSRCIIYVSSYSGEDADTAPYNLVNETYTKGAHFVLGFKNEVSDDVAKTWLTGFFDAISMGSTIIQAVRAGNTAAEFDMAPSSNPLSNQYIYARGDATQLLDF